MSLSFKKSSTTSIVNNTINPLITIISVPYKYREFTNSPIIAKNPQEFTSQLDKWKAPEKNSANHPVTQNKRRDSSKQKAASTTKNPVICPATPFGLNSPPRCVLNFSISPAVVCASGIECKQRDRGKYTASRRFFLSHTPIAAGFGKIGLKNVEILPRGPILFFACLFFTSRENKRTRELCARIALADGCEVSLFRGLWGWSAFFYWTVRYFMYNYWFIVHHETCDLKGIQLQIL